MAGTFCPDWIFNLSVARTAYEFIISDLPIKSYAKKYSSALSEHYSEINSEEIEEEAELLLRFLVEINAEKSDELLNNFVFYKLKFTQPGSKRKLKGMFGSAFDPEKEKKYKPNVTLKVLQSLCIWSKIRCYRKTRPRLGYSKKKKILEF